MIIKKPNQHLIITEALLCWERGRRLGFDILSGGFWCDFTVWSWVSCHANHKFQRRPLVNDEWETQVLVNRKILISAIQLLAFDLTRWITLSHLFLLFHELVTCFASSPAKSFLSFWICLFSAWCNFSSRQLSVSLFITASRSLVNIGKYLWCTNLSRGFFQISFFLTVASLGFRRC